MGCGLSRLWLWVKQICVWLCEILVSSGSLASGYVRSLWLVGNAQEVLLAQDSAESLICVSVAIFFALAASI